MTTQLNLALVSHAVMGVFVGVATTKARLHESLEEAPGEQVHDAAPRRSEAGFMNT
jgi:hypothetical protein